MKPPVFIVGLPRSGSTLLSKIINETPDILSFNDFYYIQKVFEINAETGPLDRKQIHQLVDWIIQFTKRRSCSGDDFIGQFHFNEKKLADLQEEMISKHTKASTTWATLMEEGLLQLADMAGKKRWADKTPQNFMHLKLIRQGFPDAAILFLLRHPYKVLASYKHAKGQGHNPLRYHPLVYAVYWRNAVRRYFQAVKADDAVAMIRYEDILADTRKTANQLNVVLGTNIRKLDIGLMGSNTSFKKGIPKSITPTEKWICWQIAQKEMMIIGYKCNKERPRACDLPGLFFQTLKFIFFQLFRLMRSKNSRQRIFTVIKQTIGIKKISFKYAEKN